MLYEALRRAVYRSVGRVTAPVWQQRWAPVVVALDALLAGVQAAVLERSRSLRTELPDYWAVSWTIFKSKDPQRLGSVTPEKLFTAGHGFDDSRVVGKHESLRFPLAVGKSWDFNYTLNSKPGSVTEIKQTATVKGWETVKVPAGTFRALRIEHQGYYATSENSSTWSGRIRETFWYAPSARRIVVHEYQDTGALGTVWDKRRDELVDMLL